MSDKIIVEFNNVYLKSSRGEEVFSDLNFRLQAGRSAIITGTAGSGKSSLAELLIGRQFAYQGSVEMFGRLIQKGKKRTIKAIRQKIGGVGGIFTLIPSCTVAENITFPLILSGQSKRVRKERLMKMLTDFSLLKQAAEYPQNLTRVESMLVQFARATVANQPLIIIDEPLAGWDKKTYQRIYDFMVRMSVSGQSMVILTGEPLSEGLPNSDNYTIMNGGLS